ncbi:MAG TPA: hypothetical protein GX528_10100 [Firmicutes bacterium]|nr:hypothetical protein [Bacillota bacterium]
MSYHENDLSVSLPELLSELTKKELLDVCREEGITGVSRLRKADLIETMIGPLRENIRRKMLFWDQNVYDFMKDTAAGLPVHVMSVDIAGDCTDWVADILPGIDKDMAEFLQASGELDDLLANLPNPETLYFADRNIGFEFFGESDNFNAGLLVVPRDYIDIFLALDKGDYKQRVEKNTEIIRLTRGLLYYYGLLPQKTLLSKLESLLAEEIEADYLENLFRELNACLPGFYQEGHYVLDEQIEDAPYFLAEQERRALPYRHLDYSQVWAAGDDDYTPDTPEMRALLSFVNRTSREYGKVLPIFVHFAAQLAVAQAEFVAALCKEFGFTSKKSVFKFNELFLKCYNVTPQWILRGHTPRQAAALLSEKGVSKRTGRVYSLATKTRVGRNDPCPCGSGKKFKRCCGP